MTFAKTMAMYTAVRMWVQARVDGRPAPFASSVNLCSLPSSVSCELDDNVAKNKYLLGWLAGYPSNCHEK